jgi:hypothetical protein
VRQRQPSELEVDRDETAIEVVVELSKAGVESFANLPALERARSSVDSKLGESRREIDGAVVGSKALRSCVLGKECLGLGSDEFNVGAEGRGGQAEFDELKQISVCE